MAHSSWPHPANPKVSHSCSTSGCISHPSSSEVAAFMCVKIHTDGGYSVDTTEHTQNCSGMSNTQRLLQQLRRAHQAHITRKNDDVEVKPVKKARGRRSRRRSTSPESVVQDEDDIIVDPQHNDKTTQHIESRRQSLAPSSGKVEKNIISKPILHDPPSQVACETFVIANEEKLREYYLYLFQGLQQAAVKRVAKLWIKGICPRKQATFPYQSSDTVPQWWPSKNICPFTEPDHIKKDERLELCLHLLRLRPDPDVLKEWNGNTIEAHPSHVREGWTAFLEQIAPPDSLLDARENCEASAKRAEFLKKLYDIARIEEAFHDGGVDATYQIQWPREELQPQITRRRPAKKADDDAVTTTSTKKRKRRSSKAIVPPRNFSAKRKKARKSSTRDADEPTNEPETTHNFVEGDTIADEDTSYQDQELGYRLIDTIDDECDSFLPPQDSTKSGSHSALTWMHGPGSVPRHEINSCTTSFGSSASSFYPTTTTSSFMVDTIHDHTQTTADGQNSLHNPRIFYDDGAHLHQACDATTPNSPILSTAALADSKLKQESDLGVSLTQHPWFNSANSVSSAAFYNNYYSSAHDDAPMVYSSSYMQQPTLSHSSMADLPIHSRFPSANVKAENQRFYGNNFRT